MKERTRPTPTPVQADQAEAFLKSLANAQRLRILCALTEREHNVTELMQITGISQSSVSQHLARMVACGLIANRRDGQHMRYSLCSMEAQAILSVLYLIYCNPHPKP